MLLKRDKRQSCVRQYQYLCIAISSLVLCVTSVIGSELPYVIVDTGQDRCYNNFRAIAAPKPGEAFYGQDAQYQGPQPEYRDNGDGTIMDLNTGLMWQKSDSQKAMNWQAALANAENLKLAGHKDWRLPNAKELQSLVDYSRAPDAADPKQRGAAIDPIFKVTKTESWFWTSTTHVDNLFGIYICFGRALSEFRQRDGSKVNAHGAGAQRSDPKSGDLSRYSRGLGPQGDEIRIFNYVRCVRTVSNTQKK